MQLVADTIDREYEDIVCILESNHSTYIDKKQKSSIDTYWDKKKVDFDGYIQQKEDSFLIKNT